MTIYSSTQPYHYKVASQTLTSNYSYPCLSYDHLMTYDSSSNYNILSMHSYNSYFLSLSQPWNDVRVVSTPNWDHLTLVLKLHHAITLLQSSHDFPSGF